MQAAASKGGQASHTGGFASMDADKQVSNIETPKTAVDQFLIFISATSHLRADRLRVVLSSLVARRLRKRDVREASRLRLVHSTTLNTTPWSTHNIPN